MTDRFEEILLFWFGELKNDEDFPLEKAKMWFEGGQKADRLIHENFASDLEAAIQGELDSWASAPRSLLALVIVLDQFSRNFYRDKPESFAQDPKSVQLSLQGIEEGKDRSLRPVERVFLYMPFMHAESRQLQKKSIELFSKLADEAPRGIEIPLRNNLDFAKSHAKIIEKFGRFPYRNNLLGRESTKEEDEYLKSANESWF